MLERLARGWWGKAMMLSLLGFAATDFVITMTLSAADAAEHLLHNPAWRHVPDFVSAWTEDRQRITVTMVLLLFLGASFMRGFKEVIGLAVVIVAVYLLLNLFVIGSGAGVSGCPSGQTSGVVSQPGPAAIGTWNPPRRKTTGGE